MFSADGNVISSSIMGKRGVGFGLSVLFDQERRALDVQHASSQADMNHRGGGL